MDQQHAVAQRRVDQTGSGEGAGPSGVVRVFARVPWLLGAICGLAICLIGGLALSFLHQSAQPSLPASSDAAHQICTDLLGQEYANLYGLLSTAQQASGTEAQFEASQRQLDIAAGRVTQCTASVAMGGSGEAQAQFTVVRGQAASTSGTGTLIYADGGWRLDAYDAAVI